MESEEWAVVRIDGSAYWTVMQNPDTKVYVAACESLNIAVQGSTWNELTEAVKDVLHVMLADAFAENRLRDLAEEQGWHLEGELPEDASEIEDPEFDLPYTLQLAQDATAA